MTAFNAGAAGAQDIQSLVILRFPAGAFGSSPLINAGGMISNMLPTSQRGLALTMFVAAPYMGPTIGPIVGGFIGEIEGWRWIEGLMTIFTWHALDNGRFIHPLDLCSGPHLRSRSGTEQANWESAQVEE